MEKQGMDRRKRYIRTGLLVPLLILLYGGFLFSQTGEGESSSDTTREETASNEAAGEEAPAPLGVRAEISSANSVIQSPWSVFVWVNHPSPQEVNVIPPRFPASLVLERVRTETRLREGVRWTRVEFLFTPQRTGAVTIGKFEITVLGRKAVTGEINARFREETRTVRRYEPRFRWTSPSSPLRSGEQRELLLELTNWDPSKNAPPGIFRGRVPRNAILEEKLPVEAGEGIYRYIISIIPLEGSDIALEPFSFQAEGFTLNIPGLKVSVLPVREDNSGDPASQNLSPTEDMAVDNILSENIPPEFMLLESLPAYPSPENREKIFPLFRREYSRIITGVQILWDKGSRAEALAEIRRNERDSLIRPFLVPLRIDMEQTLGLKFTDDEKWRPMKISLLSWVILGFLLLSAGTILLVFRPRGMIRRNKVSRNKVPQNLISQDEVAKENVTSGRRRGFKTGIVLVLSIGLAIIFLEEGFGNFLVNRLSPSGKTAVLERTAAYRVPDLKGAVNVQFGEGQPVIVSDYRLDWCYAESSDGRSGWVPREMVIIY